MQAVRLVMGDQLNRDIAALADLDPKRDVILMVEVWDENTYVRHHQQKIALVLSAMRHFAESLVQEGLRVDYVFLDDEGNTGSFSGEIRRALERHHPARLICTEPGEWRVWRMLRSWQSDLGIPVEIRPDDRFLCSLNEFASWAEGRKGMRMEHFYHHMRRKTGWLMEDDQPAGGRWNFDRENRKALPAALEVPPRRRFHPDAVTQRVIETVRARFSHHFGDLEPFGWAVTRSQALEAMRDFINDYLADFGEYQDAMRRGDDWLFHAALSPYLNIGLLTAKEVCLAALDAYQRGQAPLSAVEGFIRQILGWREYIRGIYWLHMPAYPASNYFGAKRQLPPFYWTGETSLACLREVISGTRRNAYAHHIQRLMLTGNFALLAGIEPSQVEEWYLIVYADAFEWVELPNTHGMALFADGGLLASKPYAASGAYINRMSDYCPGCTFDPDIKLGPGACPLNYLDWNFLIEHQALLRPNPRMAMPYRTLDRMEAARRQEIVSQAGVFLSAIFEE